MTFKDALKKLDIEDYGERIFNSSSHGDLFHLGDYVVIAEAFTADTSWFRRWFVNEVEDAEERWNRPESVFQHIPKLLQETLTMSKPDGFDEWLLNEKREGLK